MNAKFRQNILTIRIIDHLNNKPMSHSNHHTTLMSLCQTLTDQGQSPSVGLLRGQAPFKVSVIEAINAIKSYNLQQAKERKVVKVDDKTRIKALEERVEQLESALAIIESRLAKFNA